MNPKLTLPYWDFTIEDYEAEKDFTDDDLEIDSPIFQGDWFGSADPVDNVVSYGIVVGCWIIVAGPQHSLLLGVDRHDRTASSISRKLRSVPVSFVLLCGASSCRKPGVEKRNHLSTAGHGCGAYWWRSAAKRCETSCWVVGVFAAFLTQSRFWWKRRGPKFLVGGWIEARLISCVCVFQEHVRGFLRGVNGPVHGDCTC